MNDDANVDPVDLSPTRAELIARVRARGRQIRARRRVGATAFVVIAIAVPAITLGSHSTSHSIITPATVEPTRHGDFRIAIVTRMQTSHAHPGEPCVPGLNSNDCYSLGRTLVTAADVRAATVRYDSTQGWGIDVELSESGAHRLETAPPGTPAAIIVGHKVISAPVIEAGITGRVIEVAPQTRLTHARAVQIAAKILGRTSTAPTTEPQKPRLDAHVVLSSAGGAPCTQTLPEGSCLVLGRTLFTDRDVLDLAVFYRQDHAAWAIRLTLDPAVIRAIRALPIEEIAIVVAGNLKGSVYLPQDIVGNDVLFEPYTNRAGDIFYGTQILGHAPTHVEVRPLTAHIELASADLTAGQSVRGSLVVDNASATPITIAPRTHGCRPQWRVLLTNRYVPPSANFPTACDHSSWTIPVGETRYDFMLVTKYQYCTAGAPSPADPPCLPGHRIPTLPVGTYLAVLESQGAGAPIPAPITVDIVNAS